MTLLPWLVACQVPTWTAPGALEPHRQRLDRDGDGRVSAAEYEGVLWNGPPFATVDADGNGDLAAAELVVLVRAQAPTSFDTPGAIDSPKRGGAGVSMPEAGERDVWEVLVWMGDAVRAAGGTGPSPHQVARAVRTGRMDSMESREVLDLLRPQWRAYGWLWPAGIP